MQIHWRNPHPVTPELREKAEARLQELADGRTDLVDVWIDVDKSQHHRQGADRVAIRCMVRDTEIVGHGEDDDPDRALSEALSAVERELHRHRERLEDRRRRARRTPEPDLG